MINDAFNHRFFTPELKEQLQKLYKATLQTEFVVDNASNVLMRESEDNTTFALYTSAHPQDVIKYSANENTVYLQSETTN